VLLKQTLWEGRRVEVFPNGWLEVDPRSLLKLVAFFFFMPAVNAGFLYLGLLAVRCQGPRIGKLLSGFPHYWLLVRANLLYSLVLFVPAALIGIGAGGGWLLGPLAENPIQWAWVGALVGLVPALVLWLYLYARLCFASLLILDPLSQVSSAGGALRASASVTRPVVWRLAGVLMAVQALTAVSFVCFFLPGFLLGIPLSCAVLPAAYEMVRHENLTEEVEA
jgi:hypothetical protein